LAGVCLTPYVPLSGFDYPLSGFLLPHPLDRFSDPSVLGVHPFRVFLPSKSQVSLETLCSPALSPTEPGLGSRKAWTPEPSSL
jgi:hypothetical protein